MAKIWTKPELDIICAIFSRVGNVFNDLMC